MDEQTRGEWLAVAWETLKHLPSDLLAIGCRKARETADHPSKIVPTIMAETREMLDARRDVARPSMKQLPEPEPERCTPEQARAILEEFGLQSAFPSSRGKHAD